MNPAHPQGRYTVVPVEGVLWQNTFLYCYNKRKQVMQPLLPGLGGERRHWGKKSFLRPPPLMGVFGGEGSA